MLPVIKRANILVNHVEIKFLILHNETSHESYMHIARATMEPIAKQKQMIPVIKIACILVNPVEIKFLILHNETNHES